MKIFTNVKTLETGLTYLSRNFKNMLGNKRKRINYYNYLSQEATNILQYNIVVLGY